jgi:hypothetical protein
MACMIGEVRCGKQRNWPRIFQVFKVATAR